MTAEQHTDQCLQIRFGARDAAAFQQAYHSHAGRMYGTAYRILSDHGLAADAVQNAFLRAWQGAGGYDPARPLGAWLHAIVRRTAVDLHRRGPGGAGVVVDHDILDTLTTADPGIEPVWVGAEVRAALAELPAADRAILVRIYYQGRTVEETATELGIPVGTVKSRLSRALRSLGGRLAHLTA